MAKGLMTDWSSLSFFAFFTMNGFTGTNHAIVSRLLYSSLRNKFVVNAIALDFNDGDHGMSRHHKRNHRALRAALHLDVCTGPLSRPVVCSYLGTARSRARKEEGSIDHIQFISFSAKPKRPNKFVL